VKVTVRDLITSIDSNPPGRLIGLSRLVTVDLPVRMAYRLGRLLDSAESALKQFQLDRKPLFEKFGEDVNGPDGVKAGRQIPAANQDTFNAEQDKLLDVEVDIWFEPVTLAELGNINLTAQDMTVLGPFILEGENGL